MRLQIQNPHGYRMHRHCDLEGVFEDAFADQRGNVGKAGSKEAKKQGW